MEASKILLSSHFYAYAGGRTPWGLPNEFWSEAPHLLILFDDLLCDEEAFKTGLYVTVDRLDARVVPFESVRLLLAWVYVGLADSCLYALGRRYASARSYTDFGSEGARENMDWNDIFMHLLHLAAAFVFAFPIGWDQEKEARSAGVRTFPLVSVASCGLVLVSVEILGRTSPEHSRILQGLITGIGFIGGGAILKQGSRVRGTATAASLWNTAVIGAAVGYGYYDIGLVLSVINFLTLRVLLPLKQELGSEQNPDETK